VGGQRRDERATAGLPLHTAAGRTTNLYLLAQSAAGLLLSELAFRSAKGYILLASSFTADAAQHNLVHLDDWGRQDPCSPCWLLTSGNPRLSLRS
jgi:hypothetical protein